MTKRGNPNWVKGVSGNPTGLPSASHLDGWASAVTGIGNPNRDKRMSHFFRGAYLSYQEVVNLWTKDDIARRCIEYVPSEAFREGYEIHIADEGKFDTLKDDLNQRMQDLEVDRLLERALCTERALGGCAILVGYDDDKALDQPVDIKKANDIKWLSLLEPLEINPIAFYDKLTDIKYGAPKMYTITGYAPGASNTMEGRLAPPGGYIHESRLIIFEGLRVSHYQLPTTITGQYWGESILTALIEVLRDFHVSWQAAGILATDFSRPTLTIPNLMNLVAKHPNELAARLAALEMSGSVARVTALDPKETYDRKTTNLAGFPDLLTQLSLRLSAATGIPLRLLMGQIPTTVGESDTDIRVFYDQVRGIQKKRVGPILRQIITVLMRSERKRGLPKRWNVKFHPLWVLTDQERAESRLTQARADSMYIKMGAVTPNEIRFSRFGGDYSYGTEIDESQDAPGIPMPPTAGGGAGGGADANKKYPAPVTGPGAITGGAGGVTNNHVAAGAQAHGVRGYARKNPTPNPLAENPKEGGDVAPENKRDAATDNVSVKTDSDDALYYKQFAGFKVGIESPAGTERNWTDASGATGTTTMKYDYGYLVGCMGADGDCVDVYLGPDEGSQWVTVVHQMSVSSGFQQFDEDKVMLGFTDVAAAVNAYLKQYNDPRFMGGVSSMTLDDFRMKVAFADTTQKIAHSDDITCDECGDLMPEDGKHVCGEGDKATETSK